MAGIGFLLTAGILFGQTAGTPPTPAQRIANQVSRLTTLLSLNSAQQTQATAIWTQEQTALSGVRDNMRTAHTALKTAIEANDTATIAAQATQIGELTTQEISARATAEAAFYAILTADQQTKFKQLRGGPGGFGGHGPGGPGGPGGPPPMQ
jgi:Spy/CpxP family protein refolding chaperone